MEVGSEEYIADIAMGDRMINGRRYYKVEELWWASSKPPEVQTLTDMWRSKGYYARSSYARVESRTSWNNSPNDMYMYSIYVAVKE